VLGAAAGGVAGLVAITPAAGFVGVPAALLIGLGAGVFCYWAVQLKVRLGIDDSLDVWGVHGVGGVWGALATGLFASTAINSAGANGLFFGNPQQVLVQLVAIVVVSAYSMAVTWIILKALDVTIGLRVGVEEERVGLDATQHGEIAYQL